MPNPATQLSNEQVNRYKRHLILPEVGVEGQLKLLNAKVLCIGAGGLGCPISLYLAAAGVGTIGLVDIDVVSPSNLQRQVLFGVSDVGAPVLKQFAALAADRKIFLWCHIDDATVESLLKTYPGVKVLWAHAGMSAPAKRVAELVDRYPMLVVELALRTDVASGGTLDPEWQKLFLRHPDRFLAGTDTWVTSRWEALPSSVTDVRAYLKQLPPDVAEKIAYKNAERLFP